MLAHLRALDPKSVTVEAAPAVISWLVQFHHAPPRHHALRVLARACLGVGAHVLAGAADADIANTRLSFYSVPMAAVAQAEDEVAFPVTGYGAIINRGADVRFHILRSSAGSWC